MRLRQIALVANDLAATTTELTEPLGIEVAFRDPSVGQWGLENIVAPVGGEFLEIVAPVQPGTSAGRYIERRGGDGGYMVILHGDDALRARARIMAMGIRAVWTCDRPEYVATHFHPRDVGGVLLSVDSVPAVADFNEPMCDWPPANTAWRDHVKTARVTGIKGVEIQATDPPAMAALWGRILEREAREDGARWTLALDNAEIRFVAVGDDRGPGIRAVDLAAANAPAIAAAARARGLPGDDGAVTLCGTVFHLVAS